METDASMPNGEKILSILAELYADQMGVKIEYTITEKGEKTWQSSQ